MIVNELSQPAGGAGLLSPREFRLTTFPNDEGYDEMVLPFHGVAHVGYLPGAVTVTSAVRGLLREDRGSRQEFFSLTGIRA